MWLEKRLGRAHAKCTLALKSVATQLHFPCLVWLVTGVRLWRGGTGQGAWAGGVGLTPKLCVSVGFSSTLLLFGASFTSLVRTRALTRKWERNRPPPCWMGIVLGAGLAP